MHVRTIECPQLIEIHAPSYMTHPQALAKLIIDYLAGISADPDPETVFPARIRYAAEVDPHIRLIHILVYGLTDDELARPYDSPQDTAPCPVDFAEIISTAADGRNGCYHPNTDGNRFSLLVSTLDESQQRARADQVGTVTTVTTARDGGYDETTTPTTR